MPHSPGQDMLIVKAGPSHSAAWKDIPGWEGFYQASEQGKIRSTERTVFQRNRWGRTTPRTLRSISLRPRVGSHGYLIVNLHRPGQKQQTLTVHKLIALTFIGEQPHNSEVCHNDGNKLNNHRANLRWDSRMSNAADKRSHGTLLIGEKNHQSKLTEKAVREIRQSTQPQKVTAKTYGVSQSLVSLINGKQVWAHIEDS